jgi:acylphosphatase
VAKTGDIYGAVEALKDSSIEAFSALESNDDLTELINDLGGIRDRADEIQSVAMKAQAALGEL